jgi:hypothetical protein
MPVRTMAVSSHSRELSSSVDRSLRTSRAFISPAGLLFRPSSRAARREAAIASRQAASRGDVLAATRSTGSVRPLGQKPLSPFHGDTTGAGA